MHYRGRVVAGLQHTALVVADVEASCRFYGVVLGLESVPRPTSFTFAGYVVELFHVTGENQAGAVRGPVRT